MPDVRDVANVALALDPEPGPAPRTAAAALASRGVAGTAFARIVGFQGFGSRRAGEVALVSSDGTVTGSLLGGLADGPLAGAGEGLFDVAVGDTDAVAAGLACGGIATLLVSRVASVPRVAWEAVADGRPVAVVSLPGGGGGGGGGGGEGGGGESAELGELVTTTATLSFAVTEDPATRLLTRSGTLGDATLDEAGEAAARDALRGGRDTAELHPIGDRTLVVEVYVPTTTLVVVGEAALAEALVAQGGLLGWKVVVRPGFGPQEQQLVEGLGPADAIVVLSHHPEVDAPALAAALRSRCFIGALGSRHTQARRREQLVAQGLSDDALERIHGPVGLDLGARTPEETALAIAAEILAHRSGRTAVSLRGTSGPING